MNSCTVAENMEMFLLIVKGVNRDMADEDGVIQQHNSEESHDTVVR
jgi:hypothetical protein